MARASAVWGIDLGQCALKALRCRRSGDDPTRLVAEAFDHIEYPKILSQPEADPAELVREALTLFLSRNVVRGDRVAIGVSGQSGLARFIKLPPVESKKIPDIVKYEARQQIPFALEDVIWDYQKMAGGSEEEGFALETEVGLFAMKRDQVYRALAPFTEAGIDVDIIQLTPLALYNMAVFDLMPNLPPADQYDPDSPPESVVVLALGTDSTDLVISNGYRVWQRSVPVGGSHFTKALSKELRLTFAKAEHLKRNAAQAEDQRAVFTAMRPVFNDLLTEIQRSINYFTNIDRRAKVGRVVALGNAMKLPGLQKYLSQNLGYPVAEVEGYRGLAGGQVTGSPVFKENVLSYAVCYGLAVQALGQGKLATNLLPRELVVQRLIRAKKPWTVAVAAAVLLGLSVSYLGHWRAWASVQKFDDAKKEAERVQQQAKNFESEYEAAKGKLQEVQAVGENLVGNFEGRLVWLELLKAVNQCLPAPLPADKTPANVEERPEIHIDQIEAQWFDDLANWHGRVASRMNPALATAGTAPSADGTIAPPAPDPAAPTDGSAPAAEGPKGPGWVIQLHGYHYYNKDRAKGGATYVEDTLIKNLKEQVVELPATDGQPGEKLTVKELGIDCPVLMDKPPVRPDESFVGEGDGAAAGNKPNRFDITLQFCWQPTPASVRRQRRLEAEQKKREAQAAAAEVADTRSN